MKLAPIEVAAELELIVPSNTLAHNNAKGNFMLRNTDGVREGAFICETVFLGLCITTVLLANNSGDTASKTLLHDECKEKIKKNAA
jgi:hypothetical protein